MISIGLALFHALFFVSVSYAHGEDKPGPHGGFVRMPGAFHTEVVAKDSVSLKVYLLDMEFKNPSIHRSKLSARIGKKSAKCEAKDGPFYTCTFPKGTSVNKPGRLVLRATRDGHEGSDTTYDLPLKLLPASNHQGH
jgi:hypothetical protein